MSLIVLIIVVLVILMLALWALRSIPVPSPFNWILQLLAVVLAILFIGSRAGLFNI